MVQSIELQIISKILTSDSEEEINTLCSYDDSYYSVFKRQIQFILDHKFRYGNVPDVFTFQAQFIDDNITLVEVTESLEFLEAEIKKNKQHIIFLETFNKLKDLSSGDIQDVWKYLGVQYDNAMKLDSSEPMDIIKQAPERAEAIIEFSRKARIPTGFAEIDKLMYGGLSTVEELLVIIARTNTGKSWICTKMAEAAQKAGFPVGYYSPEMQSPFIATRFDTWRNGFRNSDLVQGIYTEQYKDYIQELSQEETSVYIIEDKDFPEGVSPRRLEAFIRKTKIQLLIIDGLSYMVDDQDAKVSHEKYKNICTDLFSMSKKLSCAVVVTMQANRESKDNKDDKGEVFPTIYNAEGSDHPGRIATQVFAVRQIFDKHVLDIRLEKARMANNTKPVLSYSWDINIGSMSYLPNSDDNNGPRQDAVSTVITSAPSTGPILSNVRGPEDDLSMEDLDDDEGVEF